MFIKESPEERKQMLEDNCYNKEEMDFTREYNSDDLEKLKHEYSQDMIFLAKKQEDLDQIKKDFKGDMDPIKLEAGTKLRGIRSRNKEVCETVYAFDDQKNKIMEFYDLEGKMVYSRPLTQNERQLQLKAINNETETN